MLEKRPSTKFVICTGSKELRSNSPQLLAALKAFMVACPNLMVKTGCTKEMYYKELLTAKIQMNTALQDFVPLTLLEASVAGAYPVYPWFRSFPDTFENSSAYLYPFKDVDGAAEHVIRILDRCDLWTEEEIKKRSWIHSRFDSSWARQLKIMGLMGGDFKEELEV